MQGCHNELVASKPTESGQQAMISQWMSWAATCHGGTDEGKAHCLALFTALQKLKNVLDPVQVYKTVVAGSQDEASTVLESASKLFPTTLIS